jgi:hypothetical protein
MDSVVVAQGTRVVARNKQKHQICEHRAQLHFINPPIKNYLENSQNNSFIANL